MITVKAMNVREESNDIEVIKQIAEYEMKNLNSIALYNSLVEWGKGNEDIHTETLNRALNILNKVVLEDYRDQFVIRIPKGEKFYRARAVKAEDYGELGIELVPTSNRLHGFNREGSKEPPKEKAKAGRLSYNNERALYLATDEATACSEVKPEIRQLISVATFISEEELEIIDFSKLKYTRPLNIYDDKYSVDIRSFLGKVRALFVEPIYDGDYCVTQKITKYFREKGYQGFKYASFYAKGDNYTFFRENMKKFKWESSRIVINYAVANLFLSMDKVEDYADIQNTEKIEKEVSVETRAKLFEQTKKKFCEEAKNYE